MHTMNTMYMLHWGTPSLAHRLQARGKPSLNPIMIWQERIAQRVTRPGRNLGRLRVKPVSGWLMSAPGATAEYIYINIGYPRRLSVKAAACILMQKVVPRFSLFQHSVDVPLLQAHVSCHLGILRIPCMLGTSQTDPKTPPDLRTE